ncbi:amidohydrolase family protein [Chloroflexota bacterium]
MIIDAHTHGLHGKYLEKLATIGGGWASKNIDRVLEAARGRPHYIDVALRVAQLDRNGFDLQVVTPAHGLDCNLSPGDGKTKLAMAVAINDNMARMMEDSKGRLLTAGNIPLEEFEGGGRQEMERAITTLGLKGIGLPSHIRGKPLDLPAFEPFWATVAEMGVPVFVHPIYPVGQTDRSYEAEYSLAHNFGWPFETTLMLSRLVFSGIMERYPGVKVVSHHLGGGMIPFFWGRINETYALEVQAQRIGRTLPKPLIEYFSLFYYDTAGGAGAPAIKCTYDLFGVDQLVFATDAPWGLGGGEARLQTYSEVIKSLPIPEEDKAKIMSGNAKRLLNLK